MDTTTSTCSPVTGTRTITARVDIGSIGVFFLTGPSDVSHRASVPGVECPAVTTAENVWGNVGLGGPVVVNVTPDVCDGATFFNTFS